MTKEEVIKRITGAWKLDSWIFIDDKNNEVNYFGDAPEGLLIFDPSGYISVQVQKDNRKKFDAETLGGGSMVDKAESYESYLAYYGRYSLAENTVLHHDVVGSLIPNWVGTQHIRHVNFKNNQLVLSTDPIKTENGTLVFHISWSRPEK